MLSYPVFSFNMLYRVFCGMVHVFLPTAKIVTQHDDAVPRTSHNRRCCTIWAMKVTGGGEQPIPSTLSCIVLAADLHILMNE